MQGKYAALNGKKALVVGLGISGLSAARFLLHNHDFVYAADDKLGEIENTIEVKKLVEESLVLISGDNIPEADFVVLSPGVPPSHPLVVLA